MLKNWFKDIYVWGDSLIKGIVFDAAENRYLICESNSAACISKKLGIPIVNRARFGYTAPKGMALLTKDLEKNIQPDIALLEFGGNDCDYNWAEISERPYDRHLPKTPPAQFTREMETMVALLRKKGIIPILMSIPPIDSQRYFDFFTRNGLNRENILTWLGDVEHIYRWQEYYSSMITNVAIQTNCRYIDMRGAFLAHPNYKQLLCEDGIHLNDEGHQLMSSVFEDYIAQRARLISA